MLYCWVFGGFFCLSFKGCGEVHVADLGLELMIPTPSCLCVQGLVLQVCIPAGDTHPNSRIEVKLVGFWFLFICFF